jgi:hypothetical protein
MIATLDWNRSRKRWQIEKMMNACKTSKRPASRRWRAPGVLAVTMHIDTDEAKALDVKSARSDSKTGFSARADVTFEQTRGDRINNHKKG